LKFLSDRALRNGGVPFLLFVALCAPLFAQESPAFDGKSWWEHVKVIASDEMEGRDTGSPGLRKAQAYIVEELKKSGIQPAGSEGFYQPIEFISRQLDESRSSMALVRKGKVEPLVFGGDDNLNKPVDPLPHVDAPLIFAGYGLRIRYCIGSRSRCQMATSCGNHPGGKYRGLGNRRHHRWRPALEPTKCRCGSSESGNRGDAVRGPGTGARWW